MQCFCRVRRYQSNCSSNQELNETTFKKHLSILSWERTSSNGNMGTLVSVCAEWGCDEYEGKNEMMHIKIARCNALWAVARIVEEWLETSQFSPKVSLRGRHFVQPLGCLRRYMYCILPLHPRFVHST